MRNVYVDPPPVVSRPAVNRAVVFMGMAMLALAMVVGSLWVGREAALEGPQSGTTELSRAQQAEADRLNARAEALTLEQALRRQEAESARWTALAEHYRRERAKQAEMDRLTGLAEREAAAGR